MSGYILTFAFALAFRYLRTVVNFLSFWTYRSIPPQSEGVRHYNAHDVSVIIPTLDGDSPEIRETVRTILANRPFEIIIVTTNQNYSSALELAAAAQVDNIRVFGVSWANKRVQMIRGVHEVQTNLTVFSDDDVFWKPRTLDWMLAPFENLSIGGVGTCQRLRRASNSSILQRFWSFLGALYLERRNFDSAATSRIDGGLPCLSGRTVAYRTSILQDETFQQAFQNERWWGQMLNAADDDNFLTRWFTSRGWNIKIQYNNECEVETTLADNSKFLCQCLRWCRSTLRSDLTSLFIERRVWRLHPWTTYSVLLTSLTAWALFYDVILVYLCYRSTNSYTERDRAIAFGVLFIFWFFAKIAKILGHFVRYPHDICLLPVSILYGYFHSVIIKPYAFLTLEKTKWGSRINADVDDVLRMMPICPPPYLDPTTPKPRKNNVISAKNAQKSGYETLALVRRNRLHFAGLPFSGLGICHNGSNKDFLEGKILDGKASILKGAPTSTMMLNFATCQLVILWEFYDYLSQNYEFPYSINQIPVLIGSDRDAWCTTCERYLLWAFPIVANPLLQVIQASQTKPGIEACVTQNMLAANSSTMFSIGLTLEVNDLEDTPSSRATARISGSPTIIEEVIEALAWVSSAFRPVNHLGLYLSKVKISKDQVPSSEQNRDPTSTIREQGSISLESLQPVDVVSGYCWNGLFSRKLIAVSKIPPRNVSMKGLEVDLDALIYLSGVQHHLDTSVGLVLVGFRSILMPVITSDDATQLQWHFIGSSHGTEVELFDMLDNYIGEQKESFSYRAKKIEDIKKPERHFIGWCRYAIVTLGTKQDAVCLEKLHRSRATEVRDEWTPRSRTLGIFAGFQNSGLGVSQTWDSSRTEINPFSSNKDRVKDMYSIKIFDAKNFHTLLYCPSRQQAWLVPYLSVLLQLTIARIHRLCQKDPDGNNHESLYPFIGQTHDPTEAAYEILRDHQDDTIQLPGDCSTYKLRDLVTELHLDLNYLVRPRSQRNGKLYGWEFEDFVSPEPTFRPKCNKLASDMLGGWAGLIDQVEFVLFFEGLQDPIRPDDSNEQNHLCNQWRSQLPENKGLLATTVATLKSFSRRRNGTLHLQSAGYAITTKLFWDNSIGRIFEPCEHDDNQNHETCDRAQLIVPNEPSLQQKNTSIQEYPNGALVFTLDGFFRRKFKRFVSKCLVNT